MKKPEEFNIKSEILKDNWNLIGEIYITAKEKYKDCYAEYNSNKKSWKYETLFEFLTKEWENIYPKFILLPIENQVFDLFHTIQTKGFEKEKNISEEIDKFSVYFCLFQYFYIFVNPSLEENYTYEEFPRFEIKPNHQNRFLYILFEEIWSELKEDNDDEFGDFIEFDLSNFYDIEFRLLCEFLSKCWNETKSKTGSKAIATLSEATGSGENYFLDENRILSEKELMEIIYSN